MAQGGRECRSCHISEHLIKSYFFKKMVNRIKHRGQHRNFTHRMLSPELRMLPCGVRNLLQYATAGENVGFFYSLCENTEIVLTHSKSLNRIPLKPTKSGLQTDTCRESFARTQQRKIITKTSAFTHCKTQVTEKPCLTVHRVFNVLMVWVSSKCSTF